MAVFVDSVILRSGARGPSSAQPELEYSSSVTGLLFGQRADTLAARS